MDHSEDTTSEEYYENTKNVTNTQFHTIIIPLLKDQSFFGAVVALMDRASDL